MSDNPAWPGRSRRATGLFMALLVGVMGLAAFASVRAWQMQPPADASADVSFARDMLVHHEQAVEMALILRDRTRDAELKQFALDMLLTQQAQIGQMQGWLAVWAVPINGSAPPMQGMGQSMGMATQQQLNQLRTLPPAQAEVEFLTLMIRHHSGGVAMAHAALLQAKQPVVRHLAEAIVASQQNEIDYMQALLHRRGAATAPQPTLEPMHH